MRVTAVLFDLGGTLFGYETYLQRGRAMSHALDRLGLAGDDPVVREAGQQAARQVEQEYAARRSFLHRDLFRDRITRTAGLLGVAASPEVLAQFDAEHRQEILDYLIPVTGALETLDELRARGLYLGVVSNADDDFLGPVLARHGFDTRLDHWTSSEEARSCKPDRRIYEVALAKAGQPAARTLFVGDSPQHDVAGAHAAGMRTVLIGEPGVAAPLSHGLDAPVAADFAVRALPEILAIVDRLNGAQ